MCGLRVAGLAAGGLGGEGAGVLGGCGWSESGRRPTRGLDAALRPHRLVLPAVGLDGWFGRPQGRRTVCRRPGRRRPVRRTLLRFTRSVPVSRPSGPPMAVQKPFPRFLSRGQAAPGRCSAGPAIRAATAARAARRDGWRTSGSRRGRAAALSPQAAPRIR